MYTPHALTSHARTRDYTTPYHRFVKQGVPEAQVAEHLLKEWLLPRIADQRAKIRARLGIAATAPIDPKYERMSLSFDGCGPFLFRAVEFVKQGGHEDLCLHLLKLCAGATGAASHGQENDRSPAFPSFKSTVHTEDRRYCELFLKKDPLARTDHKVLAKTRSFWEPFHLGNSISVNAVDRMVSGVNPILGFRFKKVKPLLRFVFIHTETRNVTFSRKKIYAGYVDVGNRTILNDDGTRTGDWVIRLTTMHVVVHHYQLHAYTCMSHHPHACMSHTYDYHPHTYISYTTTAATPLP